MDIFDYFEIRKNMDSHYAGKFLIGAYSMGIFCNVTCPRTPPEHPDESDIVVLHNIYEGFACGLLPCEECEPDMYTDRINLNMPVSPLVQRVVSMIEDGYMNCHTVKELADQLHVSERYLRKMFVKETGLTPSRLAMYHRGTIAKRLLSETNIPITDIAYISGFGSVRQFNQVMRDMYQTSPTEIRSRNLVSAGESNELYIEVTEDFDFSKCLALMKRYEIAGVMKITEEESYARTFMINGMSGCFEVREDKDNQRLVITVYSSDKRCYIAIYYRVMRMFDLLSNRKVIRDIIGEDSFGGYLRSHHVPRILCWFDPHECMIYAILRQTMPHEEALTLMASCAERLGRKSGAEIPGLKRIFPDSFRMGRMDQKVLGIEAQTVRMIQVFESLVSQKKLYLTYYQNYRDFYKNLSGIRGLEEKSIRYIAMHGLGLKDVEYPDQMPDAGGYGREEYCSYTALICDGIRRSQE